MYPLRLGRRRNREPPARRPAGGELGRRRRGRSSRPPPHRAYRLWPSPFFPRGRDSLATVSRPAIVRPARNAGCSLPGECTPYPLRAAASQASPRNAGEPGNP